MLTMNKRKQQPNRLSVRSSTRNRTDAPVTTLQGAMNIVLSLAMLCACAYAAELPQRPIVEAAAFGVSHDSADNVSALNRALDYCRKNKASGLKVAPGTYRFTSDTPVWMERLRDFTFDGGGAKFVFFRKKGESFRVMDCERTTIKNLSVGWDWEKDPLGSLAAGRVRLDCHSKLPQ